MSGRIEDLPDADLALRLADEATEKWPELAEYLRSVGDFIQRSKGCALVPDVRPGDHIEVVRRIRYGPNRSKLLRDWLDERAADLDETPPDGPLNAYEDTDGPDGEDAVRERQYERDHGIEP